MADRLSLAIDTSVGDHPISLYEIEVLATMIDRPRRWWDARQISNELGIPIPAARGVLDRLARLNLFDIRITDEVRYRFQPGTTELAHSVSRLVAAYRTG